MSDWRIVAAFLAFVGWMATDQRVNRKRLKLAGLIVLGLAGYKSLPMIAASFSGVAPAALGPGGVILSDGRPGSRGTGSSSAVGPPNAPSIIDLTVLTTANVRVTGSAFVGSGTDTHDSTRIRAARTGDDPDTDAVLDYRIAAQTTDTIINTDSLKADTSYVVDMAYKGASGGWSATSSTSGFTNTVGGAGGGGWDFAAQFATLGTTDAALMDSTNSQPFTRKVGSGTLNEIIDASGISGWPTANAFRAECEYNGSICVTQNVGFYVEDGVLDTLGNGDSRYWRWYWQSIHGEIVGYEDNRTHPVEDGTSSTCGWAASCTNWTYTVEDSYDGTQWRIWWHFNQASPAPNPSNPIFRSPWMPQDSTFVVELSVTMVSDTSYNAHSRIRTVDGSILYDDDDFNRSIAGATLADTPELFLHPTQGAAAFNGFQIGHNGLFDDTATDRELSYQGAFCIRSDDWCGLYDPNEAGGP